VAPDLVPLFWKTDLEQWRFDGFAVVHEFEDKVNETGTPLAGSRVRELLNLDIMRVTMTGEDLVFRSALSPKIFKGCPDETLHSTLSVECRGLSKKNSQHTYPVD
jgi:hypothetical protein